jgi:hypothetical protein
MSGASAKHEVRARRGPASSAVRSAGGEQLVSIAHLRVGGILDLQPRGAPTVGLIRAARPLPDDAFEVTLAGHAKQTTAALLEMIEVEQARRSITDIDEIPGSPATGRAFSAPATACAPASMADRRDSTIAATHDISRIAITHLAVVTALA